MVDLAEQIPRRAKPFGLAFLRALVNEGGTAAAKRLRELTGHHALDIASTAGTVLVDRHGEQSSSITTYPSPGRGVRVAPAA